MRMSPPAGVLFKTASGVFDRDSIVDPFDLGLVTRTWPTMREVAAIARVSIKAVSRVVNGVSPVSPDLTARVTSAIDRLDCHLNIAASTLRRSDGKSNYRCCPRRHSSPFSSALARSIEDAALERGVLVLLAAQTKTRSESFGWLLLSRPDARGWDGHSPGQPRQQLPPE